MFPRAVPNFLVCLVLISTILNLLTEAAYSLRQFRNLLGEISDVDFVDNPVNFERIKDIALFVNQSLPDCKPNVCFVLDGGGQISREEYKLQVRNAQIITAIVGGLSQSRFAAVQYGGIVEIINGITEMRNIFQRSLGASQPTGRMISFIAPGLQFCISQFAIAPEGTARQVNSIVLLGRGISNFMADSGPFGAVAVATNFLGSGNHKINALLIGNDRSSEELLRGVVGKGIVVFANQTDVVLNAIDSIVRLTCT